MNSFTLDPRPIALDAIAAAADMKVEDLNPATNIFDLGLDSLDLWKILMDVEDGVGQEVPVHLLDRLAQSPGELTVGDLLAVLAIWQSLVGSEPDPYDASIGDVVIIQED